MTYAEFKTSTIEDVMRIKGKPICLFKEGEEIIISPKDATINDDDEVVAIL